MIELRDLEFRYGEGDFRLRIRELAVERGSRVAVVGPSGSGKTTFLHLVAGISVPRSGRVVTSGIEVTNLDDAARRVDPEATGPLTVYVVHYPLRYFAERIGGEFVRVVFPAPTDVDPADWSPDAETVAAYQAADLVLLNGASYARWVQRASLPRARLVDTSAAFRDRLIAQDAATTHIHGPEGAHSHADVAFTTWLDPALAILQARAVANAFAEARPEHEAAFGAGLAALETALGELDARLAEATRAIGETPLLFSHPVYQYFARRYGLNARSLHWEPDEPPDEPAWRALEELLVEHPARSMIWGRQRPRWRRWECAASSTHPATEQGDSSASCVATPPPSKLSCADGG